MKRVDWGLVNLSRNDFTIRLNFPQILVKSSNIFPGILKKSSEQQNVQSFLAGVEAGVIMNTWLGYANSACYL